MVITYDIARRRLPWARSSGMLVLAVTAACGGSTAPTTPTPTLRERVVVTLAPPLKLAQAVQANPFHWVASWTVNIGATSDGDAAVWVDTVEAQIEARDGQILAHVADGVDRQLGSGVVQVPQTVRYATGSTSLPPSQSTLRVRAQISDRADAVEVIEVVDTIGETLCDGRGQIPCDGATISWEDDGVTPDLVTIRLGQWVSFTSRHAARHLIRSDSPSNAACDALNVGPLPGFQNTVSGAFLTPGRCRYRDDLDPTNPKWQGEVVVPGL